MTMPVLVPCPSCARHIAASETCCPFCASVVPEDLASRAIPANNRRLSRFALFTFASTVTAATASSIGCDPGSVGSAYGFSCTEPSNCDYGQTFESGVGFSDDGSFPIFDGGLIRDASTDADATIVDDGGDAADASEDAD